VKGNSFNSLFTKESLLSLQGCAAITLLVPNALRYLIGSSFAPYEKWVGFGVAMLLAFIVALQASSKGLLKWIVAVFNGFLIFGAATGLTQIFDSAIGPGFDQRGGEGFFRSWYP
jgi:hypothetical protein